LLAGTDLECIWDNYHYKLLPEALERDLIREEDIDRSLMRVLIGRFDLGEMDDDAIVPWAQIPETVLNNEKHRDLAYKMAQQTMTLLHNRNNVLPLDKTTIDRLAVIGPNADDDVMLWGNYNGTPIRTITILDGIKSKISPDKIFYDKAVDLVDDKVTVSYFGRGSFDGRPGFRATYWNDPNFGGEVVVTQQLVNPIRLTAAGQHEFAPGVRLEAFSARYETVFTPTVSEEIVFKGGATGFFELTVNGEVLESYTNWRTLPTRIPLSVEAGKNYEIVIRYAQRENWQANIEFDFGREEDVDYTSLIARARWH
jgi:beta-glucosidase